MTRAAGATVLGLLMALVLGSFTAVLGRAEGFGALGAADLAALRFTLVQAVLSAAFSVALAVPVARALARRRFRGRDLLVTALGAPFLLPVIVAVMGLLALFGRSGLINGGLQALGLPAISIYGLQGVLVAHVFLNLPLAVRVILNGWASVPAERFRLAAALDLGPRDIARLIERPMLRATLPGAALAIFLICLTSFTVALTLGGGPRATTLELAIYQAFRLDFDLGHAASLAAAQMAVSLAAAVAALGVVSPSSFGAGMGRVVERWDSARPLARAGDAIWIGALTLFLMTPIALVLWGGAPHLAGLPAAVWPAAARSVAVAAGAAALAVALSLALGLWLTELPAARARLADGAAMLMLTASPLVLGAGLFLILRPVADPVRWALPVTLVVNAAMALPFCLRILMPALAEIRAGYGRLADSLDLTGRARLRLVILPRLRRPLWFAAGLSAALSMGDLGVIALFSDPARATLPMQIYALMSAYRMDQAVGASVLLLILSFAVFWLLDRKGHRDVDA